MEKSTLAERTLEAVDRRFDTLVDAVISLVISAKLFVDSKGVDDAWAGLVDQHRRGNSIFRDPCSQEFEEAAAAVVQSLPVTECELLWPSCEQAWESDTADVDAALTRADIAAEVLSRPQQRVDEEAAN
jgi:hypothetical protein